MADFLKADIRATTELFNMLNNGSMRCLRSLPTVNAELFCGSFTERSIASAKPSADCDGACLHHFRASLGRCAMFPQLRH